MPRETENKYQKQISREVFDRTPKAVFAALAVSYFINTEVEHIDAALLDEWQLLYMQGIIPQKPPNISVERTVDNSSELLAEVDEVESAEPA